MLHKDYKKARRKNVDDRPVQLDRMTLTRSHEKSDCVANDSTLGRGRLL